MNIYLIGYMCSGKSSVGKKLALKLGFEHLDTDEEIEKSQGQSVSAIFETQGENAFRELEVEALEQTLSLDNKVVSTGGGLPCFHGNMAKMVDQGMVIYLETNTKEVLSRLVQNDQKALKTRPLLAALSPEQLTEFIDTSLKNRIPIYEKAHVIVPSRDVTIQNLTDICLEFLHKKS